MAWETRNLDLRDCQRTHDVLETMFHRRGPEYADRAMLLSGCIAQLSMLLEAPQSVVGSTVRKVLINCMSKFGDLSDSIEIDRDDIKALLISIHADVGDVSAASD